MRAARVGRDHYFSAAGKTRFPACFQLVGALNPGPTGYYEGNQARANPQIILRHLNRLSGPLLDRFDMSLEIPLLPKGCWLKVATVAKTIKWSNKGSSKRQLMSSRNHKSNALLGSREIEKYCPLHARGCGVFRNGAASIGFIDSCLSSNHQSANYWGPEGNEQIEKKHLSRRLAIERWIDSLETTLGLLRSNTNRSKQRVIYLL